MDLKLDTITGDLDLSTKAIELIDGSEFLAQKLTIRYRFFRGEWFRDQRLGVPYFQRIFEKGITELILRSILAKVAVTTPGIVRVDNFSATIDKITRQASVSLTAILEDSDEPLDFSTEFII